ncbi:MAG: oxidoreductase [Verrucomicrobiota bacterium]
MNTTQQKQKVALVTGASSGMGKVIATRLIEGGFKVIAAARRSGEMNDLKKLGADIIALDVSNEESITAAAAKIEADFGGVDVLVNNAGFGLYGAIEDVAIADARYQFEVNLFGLARLTQLLLPTMRKKGTGKIINITSMGGKIYTPLGAWYHASKHALEGWSDCLRIEVADKGIQVVVIEPGIIRTNFSSVLSNNLRKYIGRSAYSNLVKKVADSTDRYTEKQLGSSPDVIANVVFKAINARSPKTRYAAGQYAKMTMFMRKWFGDRFYDKMVMNMLK